MRQRADAEIAKSPLTVETATALVVAAAVSFWGGVPPGPTGFLPYVAPSNS